MRSSSGPCPATASDSAMQVASDGGHAAAAAARRRADAAVPLLSSADHVLRGRFRAARGPQPQLTPPPKIDDSINPFDRAAVIKSRDEFFKEQLVRGQEIIILKDKLRWCYVREGVNHMQNCRELALQYMEVLRVMKSGRFEPYKAPTPKSL
nr:hypothetical protein HK105_007774 [Polyrhizophydium stewartii]